jgi:JmjC domain, hydroxylase
MRSTSLSVSGFKKFPAKIENAGICIVQQRAITFGDHQQQSLQRHGETQNQYFTVDTSVKQLRGTTEAFAIPKCLNLQVDDSIERNPAEALENYLHDDLSTIFHYLITEAHTKIQREAIGLRSTALQTTPRLLSTKQQFVGIHSPYVYICPRRSYTGFHKEDFNLQSVNLLHAGAPNVWILLPAHQADQFEARIAQLFGLKGGNVKCSQFVRHQNVIIPPKMLELWGVTFQVVLQFPGETIITDYNVYHYVWHTGPNISEAINICDKRWLPPPMYRCCSNNLTCGRGPFVSHSGMRIGDLRKLSIKPMHVPYEEIEMDSDSYTDLKIDKHHKAKNGRGNRVAPQISKELGLVSKSTTDKHLPQAAAPETLGTHFVVPVPADPSVVIPDSPDAIPSNPDQSIITPGTDIAVATASQTVINHLMNETAIEEQLDALIAEGIGFGPYFNLTSADAEAMFRRFQSAKAGDATPSWLNDTALSLTLEVLSQHDAGVEVVDSISIDSSQWEPLWCKQPDLVLIPVCVSSHWILVRIDVVRSIIFHHGRLSYRKGTVLEIARKIDSRRSWALQEVPNVSFSVRLVDWLTQSVYGKQWIRLWSYSSCGRRNRSWQGHFRSSATGLKSSSTSISRDLTNASSNKYLWAKQHKNALETEIR